MPKVLSTRVKTVHLETLFEHAHMKLSSGTLLTEFSLQNILSWKQQINVSRWTLGLHVLFEFGIFEIKHDSFTKLLMPKTLTVAQDMDI